MTQATEQSGTLITANESADFTLQDDMLDRFRQSLLQRLLTWESVADDDDTPKLSLTVSLERLSWVIKINRTFRPEILNSAHCKQLWANIRESDDITRFVSDLLQDHLFHFSISDLFTTGTNEATESDTSLCHVICSYNRCSKDLIDGDGYTADLITSWSDASGLLEMYPFLRVLILIKLIDIPRIAMDIEKLKRRNK